jgi:hypothetical protein
MDKTVMIAAIRFRMSFSTFVLIFAQPVGVSFSH